MLTLNCCVSPWLWLWRPGSTVCSNATSPSNWPFVCPPPLHGPQGQLKNKQSTNLIMAVYLVNFLFSWGLGLLDWLDKNHGNRGCPSPPGWSWPKNIDYVSSSRKPHTTQAQPTLCSGLQRIFGGHETPEYILHSHFNKHFHRQFQR